MQCLYVAGTTTECLLRSCVRLWEVKYAVFAVGGTTTECLLRRGVRLWEVKYAVFVCGWDHN